MNADKSLLNQGKIYHCDDSSGLSCRPATNIHVDAHGRPPAPQTLKQTTCRGQLAAKMGIHAKMTWEPVKMNVKGL